ncbi:MAG TPA: glycosyltransferase family 39 protein [archaeon]|nr:glycosyltransferase family 39 protein [archaeon]
MQLQKKRLSRENSNFLTPDRQRNLLISLFILLFAAVLLRNAWLSDDAYITFRTVDNFINGYGLSWNTAERVQTYTHPLWMFLLSAFYFLTHEIFYTGIFLSAGVSLAVVLVFAFGIARNTRMALLGIGMLLFSKAFMDYSTSGLENPLTHLLLLLFLYLYLNSKKNARTLLFLSLIAALGMLNRMDTALLYLPCLVFVFIKTADRRRVYAVASGFVPLLIWEAFSLFYYGFLFPNTAYTKLNTGIDSLRLIVQGCRYLLESVEMDHLTVFLIAAVTVITLVKKEKPLIPVVLGAALYIVYVVKIGGCFMSGRFLAAPMLCSVAVLSRFDKLFSDNIRYAAAWFLVLLLGFSSPHPPLLSGPECGKDYISKEIDKHWGICDERAFYYQSTGLLKAGTVDRMPTGLLPYKGRKLRESGIKVPIEGVIGMMGYFAGPGVHFLDPLALADPLLARLPVQDKNHWRIGHFERRIPDGYIETLETGKNAISNKDLAAYYDKLKLVTRGELLDPHRLKEIFNFVSGENRQFIQRYIKRQKLVFVKRIYLDPESEAFSYIKRCLEYDSRSMLDSSSLTHMEMLQHGVKISEEERYYWFQAMWRPAQSIYQKMNNGKIVIGDLIFQLRFYSLTREDNKIANLYGIFLLQNMDHSTWSLLSDFMKLFRHEAYVKEAADDIFERTDNIGLRTQVYANLLILYDQAGYPDSASSIYLKLTREGILLSDRQKRNWIDVMESQAPRYTKALLENPLNTDYYRFFLRYFWTIQDLGSLRGIINAIHICNFTPSDWLRILEMVGALNHPEWFAEIKNKALIQYPDSRQLREISF